MQILARALALSALLSLAACGQPAPSASQASPAAKQGETPVALATTRNMPDWLLVARQRDCRAEGAADAECLGEVHFNQRTITRSADGLADIWVQARHGQPQLYNIESETASTTIRFELERLHYRFNCSTEQFVVVERQIMGAGETVVARDEPRQIWRAPARGSITHVVMPIACHGG